MKCKDNTVYIEHMLSCIEKINSYTEGSREKFLDSPLVQDAVIRNLQVLAESSQRISDDLKQLHDDIAWRDISGFRNILAMIIWALIVILSGLLLSRIFLRCINP